MAKTLYISLSTLKMTSIKTGNAMLANMELSDTNLVR